MKRKFYKSVCTKSILMNSIFLYTQWILEDGSKEYEMIRSDISENGILDYEFGKEDHKYYDKYAVSYVTLASEFIELSEFEYALLLHNIFEQNEMIYDLISYYYLFIEDMFKKLKSREEFKDSIEDVRTKFFDSLSLEEKNLFKLIDRSGYLVYDILSKEYNDSIRYFKSILENNIEEYYHKTREINLNFFKENSLKDDDKIIRNSALEKISPKELHFLESLFCDNIKKYKSTKENRVKYNLDMKRLYVKLCEEFETNESFIHYTMMKIVNRDLSYLSFFSSNKFNPEIELVEIEENRKRKILEILMYTTPYLSEESKIEVFDLILKENMLIGLRNRYNENEYSMVRNEILISETINRVDFINNTTLEECLLSEGVINREEIDDKDYTNKEYIGYKETKLVKMKTWINNGNKSYLVISYLRYKVYCSKNGEFCKHIIEDYDIIDIEKYDIALISSSLSEKEFVAHEFDINPRFDLANSIENIIYTIKNNFKGIYISKGYKNKGNIENENIILLKYRKDNKHVNKETFNLDDDREFVIFIQKKKILLVNLSYKEEENIDVISHILGNKVRKVDEFYIDEFDIEELKSEGLSYFLVE